MTILTTFITDSKSWLVDEADDISDNRWRQRNNERQQPCNNRQYTAMTTMTSSNTATYLEYCREKWPVSEAVQHLWVTVYCQTVTGRAVTATIQHTWHSQQSACEMVYIMYVYNQRELQDKMNQTSEYDGNNTVMVGWCLMLLSPQISYIMPWTYEIILCRANGKHIVT